MYCTCKVETTGKLANDAFFAIGAKPVSGRDEPLTADRAADTAGRLFASGVLIEILVHLVDDLVGGIVETAHGVGVCLAVGACAVGPGPASNQHLSVRASLG